MARVCLLLDDETLCVDSIPAYFMTVNSDHDHVTLRKRTITATQCIVEIPCTIAGAHVPCSG